MPFKSTDTFPENPDVQIFFHGLLMLCPDATGSECVIGVHRLSIDHKLSISVRERTAEAPDPPLLRLAGPLDSKGLSIAVEPPTEDGVSEFVSTPGPFDRSADNHPKDFRWTIDLEKLDPQQPPMILQTSGISPTITVKDGLFHTARLTDPQKLQVLLTGPGGVTDLHKIARLIGANIYLQDGQSVELKWFADGDDQKLRLPKSDEGRTYVINIDNSPSLMPTENTHSEFVEYFKVVTNADQLFDLDFNKVGPVTHGSDEAPCSSVVVGGGGGHH